MTRHVTHFRPITSHCCCCW